MLIKCPKGRQLGSGFSEGTAMWEDECASLGACVWLVIMSNDNTRRQHASRDYRPAITELLLCDGCSKASRQAAGRTEGSSSSPASDVSICFQGHCDSLTPGGGPTKNQVVQEPFLFSE